MNIENLRVLQLGKFYPVHGGVEKVAFDLTEGLSSRGIHCDWICASASGQGSTVTLNELASIFSCHTWVKKFATTIAPSKISLLRRVCNNYDIIHIHHPDPMAAVALRFSDYNGRVVLHWHSDIEKQKHLLKFYLPLQDWLIHRADLIVGTTPVYLTESPFLQKSQDKTACLPIGVSPERADPALVEQIRSAYAGKKIIFSLGRLVPYKGFAFLVEAACHLPDDYVVLIGGVGELEDSLRNKIAAFHLNGKVKLLGHVPGKALPAYYNACTLFCLPSIQKTEAFGIVQIEAMSCGKPIVATRIHGSGTAWVNEHGISGLNVEPGNAKALAEAIMEITSNETTYKRFSDGAEKRYKDFFTEDKMINNCLTLYTNL